MVFIQDIQQKSEKKKLASEMLLGTDRQTDRQPKLMSPKTLYKMAMTRKKTMKRTYKKKVAFKGKKAKTTTASAVTQLVKSVLKRNAETKYTSNPLTGYQYVTDLKDWTGFNCTINGTGELYSLLPPVIQNKGGSSTRVGDEITPTKLRVKMAFGFPYDQPSSDVVVHVYFLTCKSVKSAANYTAIPITTLLDRGDGGNATFDGSLYNSQLPINTDSFSVLSHKQFRLTKNDGLNNTYIQGGSNKTAVTSSPAASYKTLTKDFKLPTLKYANDLDVYPQNSFPFVAVGWTYADTYNSTTTNLPASSNVNLMVQGQSQLWFKDY